MRVLFTGGGSAGHVTPNLALINQAKLHQWEVFYIGSKNGIENEIIHRENIPYFPIITAKLRRYLSWKNLLAPFAVFIGIIQAFRLCYRLKPEAVFSKGGFVAFPVVVAAWLNRIPIIAHESDYSPGLANRLSYPFVNTVCLSFDETKAFFKNKNKLVVTGAPLREELLNGKAEKGKAFCAFPDRKKILLIIGGGLGANRVNLLVRQSLSILLETFNVIHLCGRGKVDHSIEYQGYEGYRQFEYIHHELADLFACADLVVSRAGANTIFELVALRKAHVLIPLSTATRGDQVHNAVSFARKGLSVVMDENTLTVDDFIQTLQEVSANQYSIEEKLAKYDLKSGTATVFKLIEQKGGVNQE